MAVKGRAGSVVGTRDQNGRDIFLTSLPSSSMRGTWRLEPMMSCRAVAIVIVVVVVVVVVVNGVCVS